MKEGPFRGGAMHILAERCSTCIFRSGNLMHLPPGRLAELIKANVQANAAPACHQTLADTRHEYGAEPAVCRGFFDAYAKEVAALRLAIALDVITEDPTPTRRESESA